MAIAGLTNYLYHGSASAAATSVSVFVIAVAALIVHTFYSWHRLSHVPGPFLNSLTGFAMVKKSLGGNLYYEMAKMADTYGTFRCQ